MGEKMNQRFLACSCIQALLTLRRRFYKWLFGTPTTVVEALNGTLLLVWALSLLSDDMVSLPQYASFFGASLTKWNEGVALIFLVAACFAYLGAVRNGYFANRLAGYALQISALMWVCVALNFFASYPPINTGMFVYGVLAVFCWVTGNYLWLYAEVLAKRCDGCINIGIG